MKTKLVSADLDVDERGVPQIPFDHDHINPQPFGQIGMSVTSRRTLRRGSRLSAAAMTSGMICPVRVSTERNIDRRRP